jgi:hypothetical protein
MQTIETRRGSGARFWRVMLVHVLAVALIFSSIVVHVDVADASCSTAVLSVTDDGGSASGGALSPLGHGLVVHSTCGCHVAVPATPVLALRSPVWITGSLPPPTDTRARPGPAVLPFEPPRA